MLSRRVAGPERRGAWVDLMRLAGGACAKRRLALHLIGSAVSMNRPGQAPRLGRLGRHLDRAVSTDYAEIGRRESPRMRSKQPMITVGIDQRSPERRARDEQTAAEPPMPPLELPPDASPSPVEAHRGRLRRPLAVAGIVENGLVRPLDPAVKLAERSRVIIVAREETLGPSA